MGSVDWIYNIRQNILLFSAVFSFNIDFCRKHVYIFILIYKFVTSGGNRKLLSI